jgi:NAD(P)H-dependent FMN reductase
MKFILLNGSPKPGRSNSGSILDHIEDLLKEKDAVVVKKRFRDIIDDGSKTEELIRNISDADVLIIAFPLYVDSLPYVTTRALDIIHSRKKDLKSKERLLLTIGNCGFPEPEHLRLASRMLKVFSDRMGFRWLGAIKIGGGGGIGERSLKEAGGSFKRATASIEQALSSILEGNSIPEKVFETFETPMIPPFIYRSFGNMGWHLQKRQRKTERSLKSRPYDNL